MAMIIRFQHVVRFILWLSLLLLLFLGWSGSKSNSNNNVGTIFINNKKLQHLYVSGHRKMLASGFDFTAILNHRQHQHQHQHHHHQHRHHHHLSHVPAHSERSETEIDPRYGVDKRLVPTGPNPLHH